MGNLGRVITKGIEGTEKSASDAVEWAKKIGHAAYKVGEKAGRAAEAKASKIMDDLMRKASEATETEEDDDDEDDK